MFWLVLLSFFSLQLGLIQSKVGYLGRSALCYMFLLGKLAVLWCVLSSDMKVKRLYFALAAGDPSSRQTTSTTFKFIAGAAIVISVLVLIKLYCGGGVCRSNARLDGKVTMSMVRLHYVKVLSRSLFCWHLRCRKLPVSFTAWCNCQRVGEKLLAFHHYVTVLVLWVKNNTI